MKKIVTVLSALLCIAGIFSCGPAGAPIYSEFTSSEDADGKVYKLTVSSGSYELTYGGDEKISTGTVVEQTADHINLQHGDSGYVFTIDLSGPWIAGGYRVIQWNNEGPKPGTYTGTSNAKPVVLTVENSAASGSAGTGYTFAYDGKTSTGTATRSGGVWTLKQEDAEGTFTVTVNNWNQIIAVGGTINWDDDTTTVSLAIDEPEEPVFEGIPWDFSCSDDSLLNAYLKDPSIVPPLPARPTVTIRTDASNWDITYRQTTNSPGGASRISNMVKDSGGLQFENLGGAKVDVYRPYRYTTDQTGPNNEKIPGNQVLRILGVTKVSAEGRAWNHGTQFPMVGWMASPPYEDADNIDQEILQKLRTARGYSFWIKVNSATSNNWAIKTAVMTEDIAEMAPERGLEWKHYFGNSQPAPAHAMTTSQAAAGYSPTSKKANWTGGLKIGEWHQIKVYLNKSDSLFNLEQDSYIFQWNFERRLEYNRDKITGFQWQIALQDQEMGAGVSTRSGAPYDITNGSYSFDLDFYGLELFD